LERAGSKRRTPGGLLASDEEALEAAGAPELRTLIKYKRAGKMASMFEAFDAPLVRARWKTLVATGRIACADPNLTNIPHGVGLRACILPDPGDVLLVADYPALELRTWAQVCWKWLGRSRMREVLNAREDPHDLLAAEILGGPLSMVRSSAGFGEARKIAKALNFGL